MPIPPGGPNFQASSQIRVKEQQSHFQHFVQRHLSQFDSSTGYRTDPKKISCKRHQSTRPTVKGFNTETVFAGMRMCSCGETTLSRLPPSSRRASDGKLNVKDDQVKCNSGGSKKKHFTWGCFVMEMITWRVAPKAYSALFPQWITWLLGLTYNQFDKLLLAVWLLKTETVPKRWAFYSHVAQSTRSVCQVTLLPLSK